ncbi:MAG: hypothetical protein JO257_37215 [Deltaproteobacteria bacterium]|nr:hypothetical protein [Deltaproteobacteria bacterium]
MNKLAFVCVASLAAVGCKKSGGGTGGGGGGGGGGGWFTGSSSMMTFVNPKGAVDHGYQLGFSAELRGIACRYSGEAWVVGNAGTLLYTNDAGATWTRESIPTTADLRTLATQDFGPVFVAGNGTFLVTKDTGKTWTELGDGVTAFRSMAAAQDGQTVLALSEDGGLWSYDGALHRTTTLAGMRAISVSADGQLAIAAGNGMMLSHDGGATWAALAVDPSIAFDDVRISVDGDAVAVGAGGAIANVTDTGAVSIQHIGTADLHTVHVADADSTDGVGFAAGEGGQVLVSHDGGHTWALGANLGQTVWGVDQIGDGHR